MFWKNERSDYGFVVEEKVQVYECSFTAIKINEKTNKEYKGNIKCLVVCKDVEEAINACKKQWPNGFVLHQISKRNQACDLIVLDSVLGLKENE